LEARQTPFEPNNGDATLSYLTRLLELVTKGRSTNSYKFALWRALARLAPSTDSDEPKISTEELAIVFLDLYRDLETKYHVRQSTDPSRDPVVMKSIRQLVQSHVIHASERLREFKKRDSVAYQKLLSHVARSAFHDVIPRFHVLHGAPIDPPVFEFLGKIGPSR
jgi:hypothetical protein